MNSLFDEEIRGHLGMRDHALTLLSGADLDLTLPGHNPSLGGLLVEMGDLQDVYTHSFETFTFDWDHRRQSQPTPLTVAGLRDWFDAHDKAMKAALDRFTDEELQHDRIDRGGGFIISPFGQHQVYREAVYIAYGKLSVYLRALERDAGEDWAGYVG